MNNINLTFDNGWYLLLIIPAVILAFIPYFKLNKKYRKNRQRVVSMTIHILIIMLLSLAMSGFKIHRQNVVIKNQVLIVADISASTKDSNEVTKSKITEILNSATNEYEVGLVLFAGDSFEVASLSKNHQATLDKFLDDETNLNLNATNIAKALRFAKDSFTSGSEGRVILVTDGLETDGDLLAEARDLATQNIRVDVLYIPASQPHSELQISAVNVPSQVNLEENFNIEVQVDSRTTTQARLEVYVNNNLINLNDANKFLNAKTETFNFNYRVTQPGLYEIKAVISHDNDTIGENNTYYSFISIGDSERKILIVEGTPGEANNLKAIINNTYQSATITPSQLQTYDITEYEQVILVNVANSDLGVGVDLKLKNYVEVLGGSILTIGGSKAYQETDMANSIYESILPVYASTDAKSMALMIVIDSSGSMTTHGVDKFGMAKLGAELSVLALNDNDYVGVVTFDNEPRLIVEARPASQRDEIIDLIRAVENRQGTRYTAGLQMAKQQLDSFPGNENFNKHVIFLTDGQPTDTGYMDVIATFGDISLTTISIGADHGIDPELLAQMVRVVDGRGQAYEVINESELPGIMEAETLSVASEYTNIGTFEPLIQTRIAAVAEFTSLPTLDGYYGTRLKPNATLVLSRNSDPIYARWQLGRGLVSSFMSDLNGNWSSDFLTDPNGQKLIANIVLDLMPTEIIRPSDIIVNYERSNLMTEVVVNTQTLNNENIILRVTNPKGEVTTKQLISQTSFTHTQIIDTNLVGIYEIEVIKEGSNPYLTYYAVSYSSEFNNYYNEPEVFAKMEELVTIGSGEIIYETNNLFSKEIQTYTKTINPTVAILVTTLILFLLDIVSRKFKFKLPNELFKKKN